MDDNYSSITLLCSALLDNDLESSTRLLEDHQTALFEGENQLNILGRMVVNKDMAIWLYLKSAIYQPNLWRTHYSLGILYKEKGETLLAKNALLKAKELNLPLYCGEYGVLTGAPEEDRLRWYTDMMETFRENNVGSANWNYKSGQFGLVNNDGSENLDLIERVAGL